MYTIITDQNVLIGNQNATVVSKVLDAIDELAIDLGAENDCVLSPKELTVDMLAAIGAELVDLFAERPGIW